MDLELGGGGREGLAPKCIRPGVAEAGVAGFASCSAPRPLDASFDGILSRYRTQAGFSRGEISGCLSDESMTVRPCDPARTQQVEIHRTDDSDMTRIDIPYSKSR